MCSLLSSSQLQTTYFNIPTTTTIITTSLFFFYFLFPQLPITHLWIMACKLHTSKAKCGICANGAPVRIPACMHVVYSWSRLVRFVCQIYELSAMGDAARLWNFRNFLCLADLIRYAGSIYNSFSVTFLRCRQHPALLCRNSRNEMISITQLAILPSCNLSLWIIVLVVVICSTILASLYFRLLC